MSPGDLPMDSPSALASRLLHRGETWTPPVPSREEDRKWFAERVDWRLLRFMVQDPDRETTAMDLAAAINIRSGVVRGRLRSMAARGLVCRGYEGWTLTKESRSRLR
jgi:hypothetical protein